MSKKNNKYAFWGKSAGKDSVAALELSCKQTYINRFYNL